MGGVRRTASSLPAARMFVSCLPFGRARSDGSCERLYGPLASFVIAPRLTHLPQNG
jgi:hypothetical protein